VHVVTATKADAFEALLNEMSTALADVVDAMQSGQESQSEIATTLVDLLQLLESRKPDTSMADMCDAIKNLRIKASDVTVQVNPTPITVAPPVVQIIERVQPGAYEVTFTYDNHDRLETARLVPLPAGAPRPAKKVMTLFAKPD
jgi:hypothetical protein